MALIVFNDGRKPITVPAEKGAHIWKILQGELEPDNEQQSAFCETVRNVYLNASNAPDSYLDVKGLRTAPTQPWYVT